MNLTASIAAFAALAAASTVPTLASAQRGSAERQTPRPANSGQPQPAAAAPAAATAPELHAAAHCAVGRNALVADNLLATAPYSAEERTEATRLLGEMQRCAGTRMASSVPLIRGALAEAVLEARFATPQAARAPALAVRPLLQVELATTRPDAATLAPAYALAECVAARHPDLVLGLTASEPASPAASAAFNALSPAFSACVTGNLQLNIDARTLRGVLAEDLYRWSVVQRDGPASPLAAAASTTPAANAVAH